MDPALAGPRGGLVQSSAKKLRVFATGRFCSLSLSVCCRMSCPRDFCRRSLFVLPVPEDSCFDNAMSEEVL